MTRVDGGAEHEAQRRHPLQARANPDVSGCSCRDDRWALILAGGEGARLRSLTRRISGDERPKQFCPVIGRDCLLEQTRLRAAQLIAPDRTLLVLTQAHERFYAPLLRGADPGSLVVQPVGRGTAPAIFYGLLRIAAVSPAAAVAVLPSDHWVSDDARFMAHVMSAFLVADSHPDRVVLLGIGPDTAETEYGWIEPGERLLPGGVRRVRRFWEKPTSAVARQLLVRGCLWNSFVMVAPVATLLALFRRALPAVATTFGPVREAAGTRAEGVAARHVYARLESADFSRAVLTPNPAHLAVLPVTDVGWSDLGQPGRVAAVLDAIRVAPDRAVQRAVEPA